MAHAPDVALFESQFRREISIVWHSSEHQGSAEIFCERSLGAWACAIKETCLIPSGNRLEQWWVVRRLNGNSIEVPTTHTLQLADKLLNYY